MATPEKIYLNPLLTEDGESVVKRCTFERQRDSQIEYIRADAFIEKACRCYCDDICEQGLCGMCFYKHDGQGQIKNTFKYNECNELKQLIYALKEK